MNELMTKKRRPIRNETTTLSEESNVIIQRKILLNLQDPYCFTLLCIIGKLKIERSLCDIGARKTLIPLSMKNTLR